MSMFQDTTPVTESPEQGHEEVMAVEETHEEQDGALYDEAAEVEEQPEPEAEAPSQEEHGEELYAGKYRSVDALVQGYKNLEKAFHESRQRQPEPQYQQQPQYSEYQETPQETVLRMLNEDPIGTLNYFVEQRMQQALNPIMQERETQQLTRNFESIVKEYRDHIKSDSDVAALHGKINEIAAEFGNPQLARNPSSRVLKMAAQELWGDSKASLYEKAKQAGRAEAEASRRAKQGLTVPQGAKPQETPKTPEQIVRERIVASGSRGFFG